MKNTVIKKSVVDPINMTRIPTSDLTTGFLDLKPNALKLLMYYYSKGDGWVFKNDVIAIDLNLKISTVRTLTRELISKGYLLIVKGKVINYFVGRKEVAAYKSK